MASLLNMSGGGLLGKGGLLPSGYTQLEYIQGDKIAYIDTRFVLNSNSSIEAKFQFPNTEGATTGNFICGARNSGPLRAFTLVGFSGGTNWASNYYDDVSQWGVSDTSVKVIKREKNIAYMDGAEVFTNSLIEFTTPGYAYIFSINQGNNPYLTSNIRLWYCKILDNDVLVRDFIPCIRNSDSVVGLYDLVTKVFFVNANSSGHFIAGPEL